MEWQQTNARQRHLIVAGAVLAIHLLLLLAALAGLFYVASRMPWPAPGEDISALLAGCHRIQGSSARHSCIETVVTSVRQRPPGQRLAAVQELLAGRAAASAVAR